MNIICVRSVSEVYFVQLFENDIYFVKKAIDADKIENAEMSHKRPVICKLNSSCDLRERHFCHKVTVIVISFGVSAEFIMCIEDFDWK